MKRHETVLKQHKTKVKDVKRCTWVTEDNFQSMYDNVYEAMVEAGVAEELPSEINFGVGRPTKYLLMKRGVTRTKKMTATLRGNYLCFLSMMMM